MYNVGFRVVVLDEPGFGRESALSMRSGLYARAAAGFPSARRPGSLWGGRALWAACLALTLLSRANGGPMTGEPEGQILAAGDRRVMILSSQGEIVWEYPTELTHDAWMLPDGHILFADGATVTEVSREREGRVSIQGRRCNKAAALTRASGWRMAGH